MTPEHKIRTAQTLSHIVTLAGILVMAGWISGVGALTSISPVWIPMKFTTAFAFTLSGVLLYFIAEFIGGRTDAAQVVLPAAVLTILLLMGLMFFSHMLGAHTGLEDLFVVEKPGAVKTVVPGLPSLPTMIGFILISSGGILAMFNFRGLRRAFKYIGLAVGALGAAAAAGYVLGIPGLYYFRPGVNSAMAFNTALLFVLLGTGFLCLSA